MFKHQNKHLCNVIDHEKKAYIKFFIYEIDSFRNELDQSNLDDSPVFFRTRRYII